MHLWEQDNLLKAAQRGMLWSTYWGFDYHRWAVAGPWWAQGWPPSSSSSSPALCHKTWVRIVHAGLPLLGGLWLQDPKSLGAVLAGWVLSARRGKGEWGHGAKGDESGGHPWGDKITLYFLQITQLRTLQDFSLLLIIFVQLFWISKITRKNKFHHFLLYNM